VTPEPGPTRPEPTGVGPARVFVYGTLRPGGVFWFQALAGRVSAVSSTVRVAGLHLVNGPGYPMAVRAVTQESSSQGMPPSGVVGEVVDIPMPLARAVLADLDRIEGVPHLFERITIDGVCVYVAAASAAGRAGDGTLGADTPSESVAVTGVAIGSVVASGDWFDVAPAARHAWQVEMGRDYSGA
jgi:gamma-glutamylcyclotransferase (GGCT)/AIG2-like uncharacterized protein YtfP